MESKKPKQDFPAQPIFAKIGKTRGAKREFADKVGVTSAVVSNWIKRGIPPRMLGEALHAVEMSLEEYQRIAGLSGRLVSAAIVGPTPMFDRLAKAFLRLPKGLQEYLARKAEELADYADAIPSIYRDSLTPPDDQEAYWDWERKVRQEVEGKLAATRPSKAPATVTKKR